MSDEFATIEQAREGLQGAGYLADESTALVAFLAARLGKPVLVEGPAGVGKTELAKALSRATGRELIRLQCYEGLDEAKALYEWNYRKQLLRIQASSTVVSTSETKFAGPSHFGWAWSMSIRWLTLCSAYWANARASTGTRQLARRTATRAAAPSARYQVARSTM